jgi:hypothetical protein
MHVDLKFVTLEEMRQRIEDPVIVWERDRVVSAVIAESTPLAEAVDPQWVEDRFWVWTHYAATKLGRGELFEVLDFLAFLRGQVLRPLATAARGLPPRGMRKVEQIRPDLVAMLGRTTADHDAASCARAVVASVECYRRLRDALDQPVRVHGAAESASVRYLEDVIDRITA